MSDGLDLDAIEQRANAATPGPWVAAFVCDGWCDPHPCNDCQLLASNGYPVAEVNRKHVEFRVLAPGVGYPDYDLKRNGGGESAEFIAAAREDVPALTAELRKLRAQVAELLPHAIAELDRHWTGKPADLIDRIYAGEFGPFPCRACDGAGHTTGYPGYSPQGGRDDLGRYTCSTCNGTGRNGGHE